MEPDRVGVCLGPFHDDPVEMVQPQPNCWLIKHRVMITVDYPSAKAAQLGYATHAPDSLPAVSKHL